MLLIRDMLQYLPTHPSTPTLSSADVRLIAQEDSDTMSLLLLVSVAIVIGQGETASYCLTDQCTTDHPSSLYEQYCCNADNVKRNIKITDDGRDKFITCPDTLPLSLL